ncbi:P2Y purinoceptor 14-like [Pholidichthys leucotaenia]
MIVQGPLLKYLKVVHPLRTHSLQRVRRAYAISVVTWVVLLIPMIPYNIVLLNNSKNFTSAPRDCDSLFSAPVTLINKIFFFILIVIFLLVLVSILFFYYRISCKMLLAQQSQVSFSSSKKLVKSRKNMLVLVTVFCVCFIPYHLVRLPYVYISWSCFALQVFYYMKEVTNIVSILNVCLDPLIYFLFCKSFRAQLRGDKDVKKSNTNNTDKDAMHKIYTSEL